ncbi:MAG: methyltransferase domain-containing protein, partial [Kribbellaceae bacterium]
SAVYQHPLAYLIGLEGVALLRGFAGDYDREFVEARLAEVCALLDPGPPGDALLVDPVSLPDGYDGWSRDYDEPGNGLIDLEQPIVREMLAGLPVGVALDAACGTGRHTGHLVSLGHRTIGVDSSPAMLAKARAKPRAATRWSSRVRTGSPATYPAGTTRPATTLPPHCHMDSRCVVASSPVSPTWWIPLARPIRSRPVR